MTEAEIKTALTEYAALAATLWAEGRSEPIEGLVGIGWVIKNRLARHKRYRAAEKTYKGVVLAPQQFSCWNPGTDVNHQRLMQISERVVRGESPSEAAWMECAWVAVGIIEHRLRDRTHGATHYLTADLYRSPNAPLWSKRLDLMAELGAHVFLVEPLERGLIA